MTERARSVLLALLLVVSTLSTMGVGAAAAAASANSSAGTFHVTQNGNCYQVAAYGSGDQTVEEFYDYKKPQNTNNSTYTYASHGTKDLQENQVSNLFFYEGSDGYSLVMVHDKLDQQDQDGPHASTISFEFSNMSGVEWKVRDDNYTIDGEPQDDNWQTDGDTHYVDWMWAPHRTDGGAFTGIGDKSITIDPGFNEEAAYWTDWKYAGDDANKTEEWRLLDEGGDNVSLDMQSSVTIEKGSCPDNTAPSAALSASPSTVANDEAVTFDASNSSDTGSDIAEYRWDFDGDGQVDNTTAAATVSHTYASTGTFNASVTVVDAANNTDTANATVTVEESSSGGPVVSVTHPKTVNVSEEFTVSANATDESQVDGYTWDFGSETKNGSSVTHSYAEAGEHNVTVTWTESDGATESQQFAIEAVESDDGGDSSPTVESFQVTNPENRTVEVSFLGSPSITDIAANVTDANGTVVAALDESDFNASDAGDYDNYVATTTVESDGTYTAELLTAADGNGTDAADGQTDATYVGTVDGEINYVNATHVWVNGSFEQVEASVGFYSGTGYGSSLIVEQDVSGSTLISSEGMGGVNGSLINLVEADTDTSTPEDELRKEHPRLDYYAESIEPRPVTTSVENVTEVESGTYEVTFGYANPNNDSLTMANSTFAGNVSGSAPDTFQSGEHNFTVTWTPVSDDERAAWTLNRSAFDQSDVTARTKTAVQYGGILPKIEFVNESAVRVTGDFDAVDLTTVSFTADGKQTETRTFGNVSGETLLTPADDATWGPVTKSAAAFHNASNANATISAQNPNYSSQLDEVRPEKVSTFVADAEAAGNGTYNVTFGYENPNDHAMNASASAFAAGNISAEPPSEFEPGRHTFTVTWTNASNESNLVWTTDFSNFGYTPSTATSPTPEQIEDGHMPPTAELSVESNTVKVNETVTFDASNSSDDANVTKYLWDFDSDDEIDRNTTDSAIGHVYLSPGTYEVTVTVVDESGQTDTASETVVVVKPVVDDPPTAHLDAVSEVRYGETLALDARESIDDRGIVWYKYYVDGELLWAGNPNATPDWTSLDTKEELDGPGTYEFTVKVWDNKHQSDKASETVEVLPAKDDDEEKDSDDNDGSDGDHDHDDNERDYNDGGDNTGSRSGSIGAADPGGNDGSSDDTETVSAPMRNADSRVGEVVVAASGADADPAVDVTDSAPDGVTAPTVAADGFAALSYLNVSGADQATFTISKARLDASDAGPDAVSLFRYDGGAWTAVETAQVNETGDAFEFRANVSDGVYAVGVGEAVTSVADVSVDSQRVEPGQQVTVTAAIENAGHADGTREVELTVGGEVVATKTVSVAADGTTDVTFTRTFDESGVYEVSVGGASAEVVVEGIETQTTTDDPTTDETTSDSSSGTPGFGVGVALVALLAAALLALRRQ